MYQETTHDLGCPREAVSGASSVMFSATEHCCLICVSAGPVKGFHSLPRSVLRHLSCKQIERLVKQSPGVATSFCFDLEKTVSLKNDKQLRLVPRVYAPDTLIFEQAWKQDETAIYLLVDGTRSLRRVRLEHHSTSLPVGRQAAGCQLEDESLDAHVLEVQVIIDNKPVRTLARHGRSAYFQIRVKFLGRWIQKLLPLF